MRLKQFVKEKNMEPTQEMVDFYLERTKKHIDRVKGNCTKLSEAVLGIQARAAIHDESKYGPEEYIPYIWLTWYYKEKESGWDYPNEEIRELTNQAWKHHETSNEHHPGYHSDVKDMMSVDLAEMACDLSAMSQEFGGDPKEYFDNNIKIKYSFSDIQLLLIYEYFRLL